MKHQWTQKSGREEVGAKKTDANERLQKINRLAAPCWPPHAGRPMEANVTACRFTGTGGVALHVGQAVSGGAVMRAVAHIDRQGSNFGR